MRQIGSFPTFIEKCIVKLYTHQRFRDCVELFMHSVLGFNPAYIYILLPFLYCITHKGNTSA